MVTAVLDSHQLAVIGQALHRPIVSDAAARARVIVWHHGHRYDARLVYWPTKPGARHRARVEFASGARLSVPRSSVWLIDGHSLPAPLTEREVAEMDLDAALSAAEADAEALG